MKIARSLIYIAAMIAVGAFIGVLKFGLHQLFREGFWLGAIGCLICVGVIVVLTALNRPAIANAEDTLPLSPEIEEFVAKFPGPIALDSSAAKWWLLTILGFVMTSASALVGIVSIPAMRAGQNGAGIGFAISALGLLFFGLCTAKAVRLLFDGSLRLDEDGFGFCGLFRRRYRWSEVSNFGVIRSKVASVVFTTSTPDRNIWSRISSFYASGRDGRLSDTYGFQAEELVQLLRGWQSLAMAPKRDPHAPSRRPAVNALASA
jgi:hypothetical protein